MASQEKFELGHTLMLLLEDFQRRLDADLRKRNVEGIRPQHRVVFMHLDRFGASRSVDLLKNTGLTCRFRFDAKTDPFHFVGLPEPIQSR